MIRKPQVIMIKPGNEFTLAPVEPCIIGERLLTKVFGQIVKSYPAVIKGVYYFSRIISTMIPDHYDLKILMALLTHRFYSILQDIATVIGSYDYRYERGTFKMFQRFKRFSVQDSRFKVLNVSVSECL